MTLKRDVKQKYGPWALITGASAGIGLEFAKQSARHGLNTILVARRLDRLHDLAQTLESEYDINTRVIGLDLTSQMACSILHDQIKDLDIGLLINNAGFGWFGKFHKIAPQTLVKMTVLNAVVPTLLTRMIIPQMINRNRGGIIFVASVAAYRALPYLSTYAATKAYNLLLGESLWAEYRYDRVDVLVLSPGHTQTEFHEVAQTDHLKTLRRITSDPQHVVTTAFNAIGKKPSVVHGSINKAVNFLDRVVTRRTTIRVIDRVLRRYVD